MRLFQWIKKEILHVIPVFIFFLIFFTIINATETFLFKQIGIQPYHFLEIAIAAAFVAKIMLVLDHLFFINYFQARPLVFGILWKTLIYWIVLLIIRICIRIFPFFFKGSGGIEMDIHRLFSSVNWNLFLSIQTYYLMLLFIFVTFRELTFKIGTKEMIKLFFKKGAL